MIRAGAARGDVGVAGDQGTHGTFADRSYPESWQLKASLHRAQILGAIALLGAGALAASITRR